MAPQQRHDADEYGPHIIIRLRADWVDEQADNYDLVERVETRIAALGPETRRNVAERATQDRDVWNRISQLVPGVKFEQLLTRERHEQLRHRLQAVGRPFRLRYYLTLACPPGVRPRELVSLLKELSFVDDAYVDPKAVDPTIGTCPTTNSTPPQDPLLFQQDYLTAAPLGIDAMCLREHWPPGTASDPGTGVRLADVEQGWKLDHEDLPATISLLGANREANWPHGTAVVGVVAAVPNTLGGLGIAPGALVTVVSHWLRTKEQAIADAMSVLKPGDVLLLELTVIPTCIYNPSPDPDIVGPEERGDIPLPAEADSTLRILVEDAVALGMTVIEAAGNASVNLDTVFDLANNPVFAVDSGAIIVAAAHGGVPHARLKASNFGSAVSCYAWGEDVATCWFDPANASTKYTSNFRNTSAAAAIIAGAAAALQSFVLERTGSVLDPSALRTRLTAGGTPSALPGVDLIGVMPDLRQAVTALCDVPIVRPGELVPPPWEIYTDPPGPPNPPDPLGRRPRIPGIR